MWMPKSFCLAAWVLLLLVTVSTATEFGANTAQKFAMTQRGNKASGKHNNVLRRKTEERDTVFKDYYEGESNRKAEEAEEDNDTTEESEATDAPADEESETEEEEDVPEIEVKPEDEDKSGGGDGGDVVDVAGSNNDKVTVEMWTMPQNDWDTDTGENNGPNVKLYELLRQVVVGFDDDDAIIFSPEMYIYNGEEPCKSEDQKELCDTSCTNNHRYCGAPLKDTTHSSVLTGKLIVEESLRRMCVWEVYGMNSDTKEDDVYYFDYVTTSREKGCDKTGFKESCAQYVFTKLGLDQDAIKNCMGDSGGLQKDTENTILQGLIDAQKQKGVDDFEGLPAIVINGENLELQDLSADSLFESICGKLPEGNNLDICQGNIEETLGEDEDPQEGIDDSIKVNVEIWSAPQFDWDKSTGEEGPNVELYKLLREVVVGFDDDDGIFLQPQMYISSDSEVCGSDQKSCDDSCTNGHRYCSASPQDSPHSGLKGALLVEESLRRMCIWEVYGKNEDGQDDVFYFDYATALREKNCGADGFQAGCIQEVFDQVGIDRNLVEGCMQSDGGLKDDVENPILQQLIDTQGKKGISGLDLPVVYINGEKIDPQGMTLESLFKTICGEFSESEQPDACQGDVEETLGEDETSQEGVDDSIKVNVEIWSAPQFDWDKTTGGDGPNVELYKILREVVVGFDDDDGILLQPQMYISSDSEVCDSDQEACDKSCTNGHRYCSASPQDPTHSDVKGAVLVEESLRRMCIWEVYGKNEDGQDDVFYFDYATALREKNCGADGFQAGCIQEVFDQVGIDRNLVEGCMQSDGGLKDDVENPILQELVNMQGQKGISSPDDLPVVYINGEKIDAQGVSLESLFVTICAKFTESEQPDACQGDVLAETLGEDETSQEGADDSIKVSMEIWSAPQFDWDKTTGGDGPNVELYKILREVVVGFDDDDGILLQPQMYISSDSEVCGSDQKACDESCTNGHRYCSASPQDPSHSDVKGAVLVEESLRRMCIWEVYGKNEDGQDDVFYFDYATALREKNCGADGYQAGCIQEVFDQVGIDKNLVEGCMQSGGGLKDDVENPILQQLIDTQGKKGISGLDLPVVYINGEKIDPQGMTLESLFKTICGEFSESEQPDACQGDVEETLGEDEDPYGEEGPVDPVAETAPPADDQGEHPGEDISGGQSSNGDDKDGELSAATTTMPPHSGDSEQSSGMPVGDGADPWAESNHQNGDGSSTFGLNVFNFSMNYVSALSKCEVDTTALMMKALQLFGDENDMRNEITDIEHDIPMLMSQNCPEEQGKEVLHHLEEFHMCSLFNLKEMIEKAPSILTGLLMRCGNAYSNMTKEEEVKGYIPEQCIRALEADSLVGRGVFGLALYPDKVCPCFDDLHKTIPECTADVWPIPINGALVKVESCLVGQYCRSIDTKCSDNLQILDECLPPLGTKPKSMDCDDIFDQCSAIYDVLPPMLTAMPMPDACTRVAQGGLFYGKHVVERYDVFRHQCGKNLELWEGHSALAQIKAFVSDDVMGIDVKSFPFIGGALGGFFAGIIFVGIVVCVKKVCDACRRCWARCCKCCRSKNPRPKKSAYSTVDTEADEFMDEPTYKDDPAYESE